MAKKNPYLERQEAIRQEYARVGERIGKQLMADCLAIVLNDLFGFGYDRIQRTLNALQVECDKRHLALDGKIESDYAQEKLDEELIRIVNGKAPFVKFEDRYPEIKKITYDKRR